MLETPQIPRAALPYWAGVPGMVQELPGETKSATEVSGTPIRDMWLGSWALLAAISGHLVEHVHQNPAPPQTHTPSHRPHSPPTCAPVPLQDAASVDAVAREASWQLVLHILVPGIVVHVPPAVAWVLIGRGARLYLHREGCTRGIGSRFKVQSMGMRH